MLGVVILCLVWLFCMWCGYFVLGMIILHDVVILHVAWLFLCVVVILCVVWLFCVCVVWLFVCGTALLQ